MSQCCTKGSTKFCNLCNSKSEAKTERNLIIEYHKVTFSKVYDRVVCSNNNIFCVEIRI